MTDVIVPVGSTGSRMHIQSISAVDFCVACAAAMQVVARCTQ